MGLVVVALITWLLLGYLAKPSQGGSSSQILAGNDVPVPTIPGAVATIPWTPVPIGPTVVEPTLVMPTTSVVNATPTLVVPDETLDKDYGTWQFRAARHHELGISVIVSYDDRSTAGLGAYAQVNRTFADQLAATDGEVPVSITFRGFFEPDAFHTWATKVGIHVAQMDTRVRDAQGMEGTLSSSPPDGVPLDRARIEASLEPQKKLAGGPGTIIGVYYLRGTVAANQLPKIAGDTRVFLADVTETVVRKELIAAGWKDAEKAVVRVDPPHPFAKIEELRLVRSIP